MQLFSAEAIVFSKKILFYFFDPEKMLIIIGPDPFISQYSPDHSPQPRIDSSQFEISGPDICSLICALLFATKFLDFLFAGSKTDPYFQNKNGFRLTGRVDIDNFISGVALALTEFGISEKRRERQINALCFKSNTFKSNDFQDQSSFGKN